RAVQSPTPAPRSQSQKRPIRLRASGFLNFLGPAPAGCRPTFRLAQTSPNNRPTSYELGRLSPCAWATPSVRIYDTNRRQKYVHYVSKCVRFTNAPIRQMRHKWLRANEIRLMTVDG